MDYLYSYLPIVLILAVGVAFGAGSLIFGRLIGPKRPNPSKSLPYESGMIPEGDANVRIPIKFYMVGLIFLLFDIEAVYVLIWAVAFQGKGIDFGSDAIGFTQGPSCHPIRWT